VLLINYQKLAGWAETLAQFGKSIIFDEVQELRKPNSAKYAAAGYIASKMKYRMGLTATPIYNYGNEFYTVLDVLFPGALGTREEFGMEWCGGNTGDKAKIHNPRAFGLYLRENGLMLRRTRADVGRELPEVQIIPHYVETDPEYLDRVKGACVELAKLILSTSYAERGVKMHAAEELSNKLRQATGIAKAPYVAEFVRLLIESGEKVVLYGWHREVYALWQTMLKDFKPALYTGSESTAHKEESKRRFVDGETPLIMISLRSGAGLDGLQHVCRTVVFGELDWAPGVHEQCLSEDTEVLTPGGFKSRGEIAVGDSICGFDRANGSMRWIPALAKTDRPLASGERMFATATEKIDLRVTEGHRMVVRSKRRTTLGVGRSTWGIEIAAELAGMARRFVPTCGRQAATGVPLTNYELRLVGWFLTDGGLNRGRLKIYQAATQPWNRDIVEVLDGCGLAWSRSQRTGLSGTLMNVYEVPRKDCHFWTQDEIDKAIALKGSGLSASKIASKMNRSRIGVEKKVRLARRGKPVATNPAGKPGRGWGHLKTYLDKDFSPVLEDVTREQLVHILHGIEMGDGNKSRVNVIRITNTNRTFLDRLQSLCVRRGLSATISERKSRTKAGKAAFDMWISQDCEASIPHPVKANRFEAVPIANDTRVWCLTNELGTLVTRRNGKVAIVGNCIGRVYRDGQRDPVTAYYLLAEEGSDPIVSEVLGVKRQQLEGVRRLTDEQLIETLQNDGSHIRKLAEALLAGRM